MNDTVDRDRIVVGVDGSAASVAALRYAARMAAAFDAPLEAVTTWTFPFSEPSFVATWSPEGDAAAVLDFAITEAFGGRPPERLTRTVLMGPPARTLIDVSADCAMLVLGSRGRGGFAGLLLGSVSAACTAHARCPVVIIHARGEDADTAPVTQPMDAEAPDESAA